MAQPMYLAERSGFLPIEGAAALSGIVPVKNELRRRARPEGELRIDLWLLKPTTLRQISSDLRQRARAVGTLRRPAERDHLDDAAAEIDDFLSARRVYGEGPRPWR